MRASSLPLLRWEILERASPKEPADSRAPKTDDSSQLNREGQDVPTTTLVDAIRVVAAGNSLFGPAATRRLVAQFAQAPSAADPSPPLDVLTGRLPLSASLGNRQRARSST